MLSGAALVQVIVLAALSFLYVLYLRLIRPNMERFDLAVSMIGGLLDVGTFICGIILLSKPEADSNFVYAARCIPASDLFTFSTSSPFAACKKFTVGGTQRSRKQGLQHEGPLQLGMMSTVLAPSCLGLSHVQV